MAKKDKGYKSALENVIEDKGLDSAIVIEALTEALAKSYKKNYSGAESIVDCKIDDDGKIRIFTTHYVVDDVNDEDLQLYLDAERRYSIVTIIWLLSIIAILLLIVVVKI